jgi:hypothetical protein
MAKCKVCLKVVRKTSIAFVMGEAGRLQGARVCQQCANDGILIVAARAAVVKTVERGPAAGAEVLKQLKSIVRALKMAGSGEVQGSPEDSFYNGRIEGLENAIAAFEKRS